MLKELIRQVKASMGIYEPRRDRVYGLLAEFSDPGALLHAAERVRAAGYTHFDAHSPFPIHGMDRAMGLGNSKVGYIALGGGLTGLALATWLQWWTGGVDYPLNISGKPFFAVEPSVPIMFELTILFAALSAVGGMLALNGLPRPYNPLFYAENFARVTDDAFFLHIAASDRHFDLERTKQLLRELGALYVRVIEDHGHAGEEPGPARAVAEHAEA
ncbi:DUF3341 domain-containing protein [Rhodocaloribacter litoris]|uniref:DUF3341 domain-containing protein n=1 Tax=Rhodocaloribacter litoris TaxID=2558931 RepID=UPI0014220099|nr:DUF3341 domain-containing protein [Rhodocaloribacter litoris]QXD15964.1 DUF3341 domain-containing protein [Rhodocaloribacter litoris]